MTRVTLALFALLAAGAAQAGCIYPRAPERVPDGKTAAFEEMAAAQKAVQQFNDDINAYNTCLDMEQSAAETSSQFDQNRLAEMRSIQAMKNNAAVDAVQEVVDQFNEQLRIFKSRDKQD